MKRTKTLLAAFTAALLMLSLFVEASFADQPYEGSTKHKESLRNANINRAPDTYTDLEGEEKDTDKNTVSISFTTDMDSGMAYYKRAATYWENESAHYPRSFMLDGGNYSDSYPYNIVFARQAPGLKVLGAAGYDIAGMGTSELKMGGDKLASMLKRAADSKEELPYLTVANIAGSNNLQSAYRKYGVNDYADLNKYRTEVAVFSIIGKDAFDQASPSKLRYEDAVGKAKKLVEEIKQDEDADIVICFVDNGTGVQDEDKDLEKKIARSVKGIDIIISYGSSTEFRQPVSVNGTRIFSLAAGSGEVGRILYDIERNEYKYRSFNAVKLSKKYKDSSDVKSVMKKIQKAAGDNVFALNGYSSGQVLAEAFFNIKRTDSFIGSKENAPLGELIADAYKHAAVETARLPKANLIAMSSTKSERGSIMKGKVTVDRVYNMLGIGKSADGSRGQALTSFYLRGSDIRKLTEITATTYDSPDSLKLAMSGLYYKYNPHRFKDEKIYDIMVSESDPATAIKLDDKTLYRVVTDMATAEAVMALKDSETGKAAVRFVDEKGKESDILTELERKLVHGGKTGGPAKATAMKSWAALADFMFTFNEAGISAAYRESDGRMVYDESKAFSHVYKGEYWTLLMMLFVALIGIAALVILVLLILNIAGVKRFDFKLKKKEN